MNETARLDGHYPPLSGVSPNNSEEGESAVVGKRDTFAVHAQVVWRGDGQAIERSPSDQWRQRDCNSTR
jgi:hypothetical protein